MKRKRQTSLRAAVVALCSVLASVAVPCGAADMTDDEEAVAVHEGIEEAALDDVKLALKMLGVDIRTVDLSHVLEPAYKYELGFEIQEVSRDGERTLADGIGQVKYALTELRGDQLDRASFVFADNNEGEMLTTLCFRGFEGGSQTSVDVTLKKKAYAHGSKAGKTAAYSVQAIEQKTPATVKGTMRIPVLAVTSARWEETMGYYTTCDCPRFGDCLNRKDILKNIQTDHAYIIYIIATRKR